ncbi:hypothetical protein F0231_06210 [Vibrio sp. RE86]|uniref:hypothetical protein n=1 Tax=Vibrio sp. RE86 TaxID=2607605 RepID=UPI00149388B3|nr:hypothetical protein [Vibrio sp. RE86]NOH79333.1 hypothetical protein [Vibrio sp. RE86]
MNNYIVSSLKLSIIGSLVSVNIVQAAVQGEFQSGGSNGNIMDKEYVNNYPYSRCSEEGIPSEDCKEFGYVFGDTYIKFEQFTQLAMNTSLEEYRASMVSDNYFIPDNFEWLLPSIENLRYAAVQGILKIDSLYPVYIDDGNRDEHLYEHEIKLAHLPGANLPDTINNDTDIIGLMAAFQVDSNGVIQPGIPGEPGTPGEIIPDNGEIIILDPHPPTEPPTPEPPPGAVVGQVCGEILNDQSPRNPASGCLKVNQVLDGSLHTEGITSYWADRWLNSIPYITDPGYGETALFAWNDLERVCDTLNEMNFLERTNWQLPTQGQVNSSIKASYVDYELPDKYHWRYRREGFDHTPRRESGAIYYAGAKKTLAGKPAMYAFPYGKISDGLNTPDANKIPWPVTCFSEK